MGLLPEKPGTSQDKLDSLLIFGLPKTGKSSLISGLPNSLTLMFEDNADIIEGYKVKVDSKDTLVSILKELKEDKRFKYIVFDTITNMSDIVIDIAEKKYSETILGKSWYTDGKAKYKSLENLPMGAGYKFIKEAYIDIFNYIKAIGKIPVAIGHLKTSRRDNTEAIVHELDISTSIRNIISANFSAIGYVYRSNDGTKNILSFKTGGDILAGTRNKELANKEFVISEMKDGKLTYHWDTILKQMK